MVWRHFLWQNYICWARGWHFRSEKINVFFSSFIFTDHLTDNNQTVPDFFHIRPFSFLERWVLSGLQLGLIQNNLIFLFIIVRNFSVDINRKAFHTGFNFVKERERRTAAREGFVWNNLWIAFIIILSWTPGGASFNIQCCPLILALNKINKRLVIEGI